MFWLKVRVISSAAAYLSRVPLQITFSFPNQLWWTVPDSNLDQVIIYLIDNASPPQEAQESAALLELTAQQNLWSSWWVLFPSYCSSHSELVPLHHTQKYTHLLPVAPVLEKVQCFFFLHIYCIVEILAFYCPTPQTGPLSEKAQWHLFPCFNLLYLFDSSWKHQLLHLRRNSVTSGFLSG